MSLFWSSAAQGQTRWLSSMAQPDIKIIASPSSSQSSEQRHCSSLKLSHMWLLHQSPGALGSPMFPRKAWQQGKHSLPNTHALSQRQPAPHKLQQTLPFTRLASQGPSSKCSQTPCWRCGEEKWEMLTVRREGWGGIQKLRVTLGAC